MAAPITFGKQSAGTGLSLGALACPLAFAAMPLYVQWPAFASQSWGLNLAGLGALLLAVRLSDAVVDPWIGQRIDGILGRGAATARHLAFWAGLGLMAAFMALWHVPASLRALPGGLWVWSLGALVVCTLGYSVLSVLQQAWTARLGGDDLTRARWVAWREGLGLAGVLSASVLPSILGWNLTAAVMAVLLGLGLWLLRQAPDPAAAAPPVTRRESSELSSAPSPWRVKDFRRLMVVYVCNGLASAMPATLVVFFIQDVLRQPAWQGPLLGLYVLAGAVSLPGWLALIRRVGLVSAWGWGMGLSVLAFAGAWTLGDQDAALFALICVASGVALGADLAVPTALLAGVIARAGHQGQAEGRYLGWWALATKANLALAAGVTLPVLAAWGYQPGQAGDAGIDALRSAYVLLPCALKLLAWALLRFTWQAPGSECSDPTHPAPSHPVPPSTLRKLPHAPRL